MTNQLMRLKYILFTLCISFLSGNTFAATVFYQDFSGELGKGIDGAGLNDFPVGGWSVDIANSGLHSSNTYVKVTGSTNQILEARDVRGVPTTGSALWESSIIDISSLLTGSAFSVDVFQPRGGMELDDFVEVFYKLDGSITSVQKITGNITDTVVVSSNIAVGSTLQILVEFANGNGNVEIYAIDNISVRAIPEPAALTLLGLGFAGISYRRKNRVK